MAENFEQATTPDGLPKWEYTEESKSVPDSIEKLCKEGWEPIGVTEKKVAFKRPLKNKVNTSYDYGR